MTGFFNIYCMIQNWKLFLENFEENSDNNKTINVVQIDSRKRTVNLISVPNWNYEKITELIGHGCRIFASVYYYSNEDTLYTDDEFLIRQFDTEVDEKGMYNPADFGFLFIPYSKEYALWGNGVIVGSDEEGESEDVKTLLNDIRNNIIFIDKSDEDIRAWRWDGNNYRRFR